MNQNLLFDLRYLFSRLWFWALAIGIVLVFIFTGNIEALQKVAGSLEAVTLIAASFIAFNILRNQRMDSLDKKLTVEFYYDNKIVLRCENAYLAGESDIRQWGQSIAQLINHGSRLDFEPYIQESSILVTDNNKQYRCFTVKFTLHSLDGVHADILKAYAVGEYPNWICAIDGSGKREETGKHTPSVLTSLDLEEKKSIKVGDEIPLDSIPSVLMSLDLEEMAMEKLVQEKLTAN